MTHSVATVTVIGMAGPGAYNVDVTEVLIVEVIVLIKPGTKAPQTGSYAWPLRAAMTGESNEQTPEINGIPSSGFAKANEFRKIKKKLRVYFNCILVKKALRRRQFFKEEGKIDPEKFIS
jgi:hypothetical protein